MGLTPKPFVRAIRLTRSRKDVTLGAGDSPGTTTYRRLR